MARPVVMSTGQVRLEWASVPGRIYRVEGTSDGVVWVPVSIWMQAVAETTSYELPGPSVGAPFLFRVEVRP